jgi:hypothetical protein
VNNKGCFSPALRRTDIIWKLISFRWPSEPIMSAQYKTAFHSLSQEDCSKRKLTAADLFMIKYLRAWHKQKKNEVIQKNGDSKQFTSKYLFIKLPDKQEVFQKATTGSKSREEEKATTCIMDNCSFCNWSWPGKRQSERASICLGVKFVLSQGVGSMHH